MNLAHYSKAFVAFASFLGVIGAAIADGDVDPSELTAIIVAGAGVLGVFGIVNAPKTS